MCVVARRGGGGILLLLLLVANDQAELSIINSRQAY